MYRKQYRYDDHDFDRTLAAMSPKRESIALHIARMVVFCTPAMVVVGIVALFI